MKVNVISKANRILFEEILLGGISMNATQGSRVELKNRKWNYLRNTRKGRLITRESYKHCNNILETYPQPVSGTTLGSIRHRFEIFYGGNYSVLHLLLLLSICMFCFLTVLSNYRSTAAIVIRVDFNSVSSGKWKVFIIQGIMGNLN